MSSKAGVASFHTGEPAVAKLARFFPDAMPVRLPVEVTALRPGGHSLREHTVLEFGTPAEVLFCSALPLEFDDHVRLENADGSLAAEAAVVAVQYDEGHRAVAVRFLAEVVNWIIKR